MSLNVSKLELVRKLDGGIVQARCPACAEGGHDHTGNHLRIYPDGKFGCCVHPKDGEHRKRIFALAGDRKTGTFSPRLRHSAGSVAVQSVKAALTAFQPRTIRTPETESENGVPAVPRLLASSGNTNSGTLGTPISNPRAYGKEDSTNIDAHTHTCKDWENGVPSVPRSLQTATMPPTEEGRPLPYFTPGGTLVIPFASPERYHWWKPGGQSVAVTREEVLERSEVCR